jgi:hypothetical protein
MSMPVKRACFLAVPALVRRPKATAVSIGRTDSLGSLEEGRRIPFQQTGKKRKKERKEKRRNVS